MFSQVVVAVAALSATVIVTATPVSDYYKSIDPKKGSLMAQLQTV